MFLTHLAAQEDVLRAPMTQENAPELSHTLVMAVLQSATAFSADLSALAVMKRKYYRSLFFCLFPLLFASQLRSSLLL